MHQTSDLDIAGSSPVEHQVQVQVLSWPNILDFLKHNLYIDGLEAEVVGWLEYMQRSVLNIIVTFYIKIVANVKCL